MTEEPTGKHAGRHAGEPQDADRPLEDLAGALGLERGPKKLRKSGRKRAGAGCIVALVIMLLLGVVAWVGLTKGVDWVKEQFGEAEDYPGPGTGQVLIEVEAGDTAYNEIAEKLVEADVVASEEAFRRAAVPEEVAASIQPGFYEMRLQMSSTEAFALLADPANQLSFKVTIPEGLRVDDILPRLVSASKAAKKAGDANKAYDEAAFRKVLDNPRALGLPAYANGEAEGYLFPATYAFSPKATPTEMLRAMVDRWKQAATDAGLVAQAKKLGYTPHELMTIASLVQAEGRGDYMPKVARVIYNRLEGPGDKAGTNGRLQIDATINYALDRTGTVNIDSTDRQVASPYNTYANAGLVPGPISSPGDEAIEAATHPAEGGWYYYVTVNLQTGETKFAETYAEHQRNVAEYGEYCRNESASGCA